MKAHHTVVTREVVDVDNVRCAIVARHNHCGEGARVSTTLQLQSGSRYIMAAGGAASTRTQARVLTINAKEVEGELLAQVLHAAAQSGQVQVDGTAMVGPSLTGGDRGDNK